ncbi:hypothetical protein [Actinomadura napierensis]|uniref:Uncharacterized protein n=1 Tax=Actinomadura napierensis TaxID=267854 RepID=A0ABN2ZWN3_9ACTN
MSETSRAEADDASFIGMAADYAYLSRLPADPAGMYRHLYSHLGTGPKAAIPGVRTVGKAVAAGRTCTSAGEPSSPTRRSPRPRSAPS